MINLHTVECDESPLTRQTTLASAPTTNLADLVAEARAQEEAEKIMKQLEEGKEGCEGSDRDTTNPGGPSCLMMY